MGKRTKITSKDDVTWIKPETIKVKKIAAKCAQKKGKTSKLIRLHEEMIIKETKSDWDEMKKVKVKLIHNNPHLLQKMHTSREEQEECTSDMELVIDEEVKVETMTEGMSDQEDAMWPDGDKRWTDTTVPPVNNIHAELEETLKKVDKEATLTELKSARL